MRWLVLEAFGNALTKNKVNAINIAIIGGSAKDPEVDLIKRLIPNSGFTYLGIDNYGNETPWEYMDLNSRIALKAQYDLVVCSQVLEHLWNLDSAFHSISKLCNPGGHIWINCPTSNMAHGSPEYYSAGYAPSYLEKNFEIHGFETLRSGCLGSQRYYKATHFLRLWSTKKEHAHPILGYRISGHITLGKIKEMLFRIPGRIIMTTWDKSILEGIDFATETYYFGRKALK